MQHTNKADMKRKIEMIDSKPSKINPAGQKKAPLKSELCAQLKDLQEKYSALDKENTWNKAIINQLELKVRQFEENDSSKVDKIPEQAGAELCQAQVKLGLVWLNYIFILIWL